MLPLHSRRRVNVHLCACNAPPNPRPSGVHVCACAAPTLPATRRCASLPCAAPPHGGRAAAHLCTCAAERGRAAPLCAGAGPPRLSAPAPRSDGPPLFSAPARARCLCEDGAAFAAAQTQRASRGRSCILLCTDSGVLRRRSSVLLSTDLGVRARGTARAELRSAQHRPGGHRKGGAPFSSAQTLGALPRFGTTRGSIDVLLGVISSCGPEERRHFSFCLLSLKRRRK
nr:uncharacterized protein LOC129471243 [Symphalangus syndactylus]